MKAYLFLGNSQITHNLDGFVSLFEFETIQTLDRIQSIQGEMAQ